jgi:hypothetical protein
MTALRAAREALRDPGGLPAGASCAVAADGAATVLDPSARRRYVLEPLGSAGSGASAAVASLVSAPAAAPTAAAATSASAAPAPAEVPRASPAQVEAPPAAPARAEAAPAKARKATMAYAPASNDAPATKDAAATAPATVAPTTKPAAVPTSGDPLALQLLLERNQDPAGDNPLRYRERAYAMPPDASVTEAEAALRFKLAELQETLASEPVGKFVNLAVFDHRWQGVPERPPVIVLQWRDWRDETSVDYPAAHPSLAPPAPENDERLADAFEALQDLAALTTASDGLDFAVRLIDRLVPCEAVSACVYDINTDELRFVALSGTSAADMRGHAVPSTVGLLAASLRAEDRVSVFPNVASESAFDPGVDGRPFLEVRDLMYRPITHDGRLLGLLHLANRSAATFSRPDAALVDYVARQLAPFLRDANLRRQSTTPPAKGS